MDLAVKEANQLAVTQPTNNIYSLALASTRILDMNKPDALKRFVDIISKAYFDCGQKPNKEDVKFQCTGLYDEVKQSFRYLRIEEVALAFNKGVRSEYGEFFGLNIKTYHQWLKGYQFDEKRKQAFEDKNKLEEPINGPVMSEKEAEIAWKASMIQAFNMFKETGVLNLQFPSFVYQQFEERGIISLSNDQKKAIFEEAKKNVEALKRQIRVAPKNRIELNHATAFINRLMTNQLTKEDKHEIKSEARFLAIKMFFTRIDKLKL